MGRITLPTFDIKARKLDNGTMARMTNEEFGARVGCHYSMASRLRSGERLPSRDLLRRIIDVFELDRTEAYLAYDQGARAFSAYLRDTVLEPQETKMDEPKESASSNGSEE